MWHMTSWMLGRHIRVFDLQRALCEQTQRAGAEVASSLADIAETCDTIAIRVWNERHLMGW